MADSAFKTQISKDENANSVSNQIFVSLTDGTNGVTVTSNRLDVNATVTIDTSFVDDSAFGIATDSVNAQGFLADETATDSVDEGDIGIARMTLDRRMIVAADQRGTWTVDLGATDNAVLDAIAASLVDVETNTDFGAVVGGGVEATALRVTIASDSTGVLSIDDNGGSITVDAVDLDIRDLSDATDSVSIGDGTDTLAVNSDGSINVVFGVGGTRVHDYGTGTPGAGASVNNDYTVVGTSFLLERVEWSGSGKMKVEIQSGPVAGLVTRAVGFSEKDTNAFIAFTPALSVPVTSTGTVRVIMTNRQGASVDVYSTIMGVDVA